MGELEGWLKGLPTAEVLSALAELHGDAAVFAVDRDRNVVLWSGGAERLLGFRAHEVVGQHCLKASRCSTCIQGCGIAAHGKISDVPLTMHRADGASVRVLKSGRAFFDAAGEFAGGIEVLVPDRAARAVQEALPDGPFHGLVSRDASMQRVFETIRSVGETDVGALIGGESGTGKELVARALHAESPRAEGPFVAINCAALVPTLLESELFGHVKGAFTGAINDREGLLLQADGGTLFLDEVAELSLELQAKLLRVVEKSCFVPVGARNRICVDVRIIAATHRSLRREVKAGRFREDLMYRLRVVPITLPPLRERRGDIELLLWHFIEQRNAHGKARVEAIEPDAMRVLLDYAWPGNVRELQNVVAYVFAVGAGPTLGVEDLPPDLRDGRPSAVGGLPSIDPPPGAEARRVADALHASGGHLGKAAAMLGVSRATLWRRRKRLGLGEG